MSFVKPQLSTSIRERWPQRITDAALSLGHKVVEREVDIFKWVVGGLCAMCMALSGIIWASVTGQISDLRTDVRVLQQSQSDMRVSVQDMKSRVGDLVDTLNAERVGKDGHRMGFSRPGN